MELIKRFVIILPVIIASFLLKVDSQLENENIPATRKDLRGEGRKRYYKAGVVEYKPVPIGGGRLPTEAMLENVQNYEKLIESAAEHNVDILVFPEYGITTVGMPSQRELARDFLVELPAFGVIPCNECNDAGNSTNHEILRRLSCAARKGKMYVIINLGELQPCDQSIDSDCPSDNAYHYNTNVVFDRTGAIIARYRKFHLYFEPQFNTPSPEYSTFLTDFEVEFGMFTCFDIIFAHPAVELVARTNIRNFLFPTAWVDELPFLTAIQAQSLWAHSNRANLLASGYHHPERGSMGSGIYSAGQTLNYTFDPISGTKLIIGSVPIDNEDCEVTSSLYQNDWLKSAKSKSIANDNPPPNHSWLREDLSNYTHKLLDHNLTEDSLCHLDLLCCNFKYDLNLPPDNTNGSSGHLRLLSFEGTRTVAAKTDIFEWQVCAVVHCLNQTLDSCTERENSQIYHLHPQFKALSIQMKPLKQEDYGESAAQPALSLIDIHFNAIPHSYFTIRQWKDPQTNTSYVEAISKDEDSMAEVKVKTIGLIQRIYGGRV